MTAIEEFRRAAYLAFPNAWRFKAEINQWSNDETPTYRLVVIHRKEEDAVSADAKEPAAAIMTCREKLAADHAERIEQARKLLGIS